MHDLKYLKQWAGSISDRRQGNVGRK